MRNFVWLFLLCSVFSPLMLNTLQESFLPKIPKRGENNKNKVRSYLVPAPFNKCTAADTLTTLASREQTFRLLLPWIKVWGLPWSKSGPSPLCYICGRNKCLNLLGWTVLNQISPCDSFVLPARSTSGSVQHSSLFNSLSCSLTFTPKIQQNLWGRLLIQVSNSYLICPSSQDLQSHNHPLVNFLASPAHQYSRRNNVASRLASFFLQRSGPLCPSV